MTDRADQDPPIPKIHFSRDRSSLGCEVLHLSKLLQRAPQLKEPIDRPHRVQFYFFCLIHEGRGKHVIDFEERSFRAPCLLIVPAGRVQAFRLPPGYDSSMLLIAPDLLVEVLASLQLRHLWGLFHESVTPAVIPLKRDAQLELEQQFEAIKRELEPTHTSDQPLMVIAQLRLFLLHVNRCRRSALPLDQLSRHLPPFLEFLARIESSENTSRNASEHASAMGISYKHLNAICRRFTGTTAKVVIDEMLIIEGKRQLVATDATVAEIAYNLGFDEPTNFVKFFKRHTAQTPAGFRRHQNDAS